MIDAALVLGFSSRTYKSYQAVISKTIVIRRIRHGIGLLLAGSARNVTEAEGQLLGESTSSRTQCCEAPRQPNGSIREWPVLAASPPMFKASNLTRMLHEGIGISGKAG